MVTAVSTANMSFADAEKQETLDQVTQGVVIVILAPGRRRRASLESLLRPLADSDSVASAGTTWFKTTGANSDVTFTTIVTLKPLLLGSPEYVAAADAVDAAQTTPPTLNIAVGADEYPAAVASVGFRLVGIGAGVGTGLGGGGYYGRSRRSSQDRRREAPTAEPCCPSCTYIINGTTFGGAMAMHYGGGMPYDECDINAFDTSAVTNMVDALINPELGGNLVASFNQTINGWQTSAVTTMVGMFRSASVFNQNINDFDTRAVTNMQKMFHQASAFNQNINNFDTRAVADMQDMFFRASAFNQNINNFDTRAVTNIKAMFYEALAFNQNINGWATGAVKSTRDMFKGATSFNQSVGFYDTPRVVTDMYSMFADTTAFNGNITGWATGTVTAMWFVFNNAVAFNQNINGWDTGKVTQIQRMFEGAKVFNQNINGWDTGKVTAMFSTFEGAEAFNQNINNWATGAVNNMQEMFKDAVAFNQTITAWDIGRVQHMDDFVEGNTLMTAAQIPVKE